MLIVPVNQDEQTDLLLGGKVCRAIAKALSEGQTVGQALAFANALLADGNRWRRIEENDDFRLVKPPLQEVVSRGAFLVLARCSVLLSFAFLPTTDY